MADALTELSSIAGGRVVGAIETAATHAAITSAGDTDKTAVWFVVASQRAHLIAVHDGSAFHVATGHTAEVKVDSGLTRDSLRIGPYTVGLKRRTRGDVEALVEKFRSDASGHPHEVATHPPPGAVLADAIDVPQWWARVAGGAVDDPWLYAAKTSSSWPLFDFDGSLRDATIWIGVSQRRIVAAAHHSDDIHHHVAVGDVFEHIEKIGKDELLAPGLRVSLADDKAERLAAMSKEDGPARLARLVKFALRTDTFAATKRLVALLADTGPAAVAADLALVAYDSERFDLALSLLRAAEKIPKLERAKKSRVRDRVRRAKSDVRETLIEAIDALNIPAIVPPRSFPWPPENIDELWAAAAATDPTRATSMLGELGELRRRQATLAIAGGEPDDWRAVARAFADVSNFAVARELLSRAIATDEDARDHLADTAWASRDARPIEAGAAFERALKIGVTDHDIEHLANLLPTAAAAKEEPSGLLSSITRLVTASKPADEEDAFHALARTAETHGAPRIAARLLVEREHLMISTAEEVEAAAERCATTLNAPREAALLLETLARRLDAVSGESDDISEGETARLWLDAAALRGRAGDGSIAATDLGSALAAEFLRTKNYDRALNTDGANLTDEVRAWWEHLRAVLAGEAASAAPLHGVGKLDAATLDALHPGGDGWLDGLRRAVQEPERPTRATLTRGLERLSSDSFAAASKTIDELTLSLGIGNPECFLYRGDDAYGVCVWPIDSPLLMLGFQHLMEDHPRYLGPAALRFALAVELTHLACRHPILSFESDFLGTSHSVYQSFGKFAGTAETVVDVVTMLPGVDQVAKLQRVVRITRRVFMTKSAVDKVAGLAAPLARFLPKDEKSTGIGREKLEGAALQFRVQADRSALLLTGDFDAAVEAILKTSSTVDVLERVRRDGLANVLQDEDALGPAEALRLSALVAFAAQDMPWRTA